MLDVRKNRLDYGAMLIPPSGYRLAKAVAATYSLDLNTLLSIPVALFFSQTMEGSFEREKVQLLEAIQRCPDVLRIYHQKGKIYVPKKHNRLYGLLEPCVVGILPESAYTAFHPKVWVLRYEHDSQPTIYRTIVLSRNLTYDRNWDIAVHMDGEVGDERQPKNAPLADFVKYLLAYEGFEGDKKFLADLRRVQFKTPNGFNQNYFFHPVGIEGYENPLVAQTGTKAICISPFVHEDAIAQLKANVSDELILLSRREELRRLPPNSLDEVKTFCISDLVVDGENLESSEDGEGELLQQNLHAKLFVFQGESSRTQWFIGSANATMAAFERNVEFILELRGTGAAVQLDRLREELLGKNEEGGIFQPYDEPESPFDDSDIRRMEERLRVLEFELLKFLEVRKAELVLSENQQNYDLVLVIDPASATWPDLTVRVSPFNSDGIDPVTLESGKSNEFVFPNISESNLSRFLRFEIWQGAERLRAFLIKVDIEGIPESRIGRILKSIINSRDRFFEYLRFLLADDLEKEPVGTSTRGDGSGSDGESIWDLSTPIFEQLLLAASRSPQRLAAIDEVISKLCEEADEQENGRIIPHEFLEFWEAFKAIVPQKQRKGR